MDLGRDREHVLREPVLVEPGFHPVPVPNQIEVDAVPAILPVDHGKSVHAAEHVAPVCAVPADLEGDVRWQVRQAVVVAQAKLQRPGGVWVHHACQHLLAAWNFSGGGNDHRHDGGTFRCGAPDGAGLFLRGTSPRMGEG